MAKALSPAQEIAIAANAALRNNPSAQATASLYPLRADLATPYVTKWLAEGVPLDQIREAVVDVCTRFKATKASPRIATWNYFDLAVRRAWGKSKEPSEAELKLKARQGMREALG